LITLHVTDRDGKKTTHEVQTGDPMMFVLRDDLGLPVEGACGGTASCGTCHIIVADRWIDRLDAPQDYEAAMLEMLDHNAGPASRLACQITASDALDGLELTLAPEE